MQMKPIGYLRSVFQFKNGTPRQPSLCSAARGSLTIEKCVFNNPDHALEGLEQFSHAWILFSFHKNTPGHTKAKVKPPRLNGKRVGVFSTRSPYRPNAVGLTLARIEKVSGATVYLTGIDIIDGTPVLDIKPFIPDYDIPVCAKESVPEFSNKGTDDTVHSTHAVNNIEAGEACDSSSGTSVVMPSEGEGDEITNKETTNASPSSTHPPNIDGDVLDSCGTSMALPCDGKLDDYPSVSNEENYDPHLNQEWREEESVSNEDYGKEEEYVSASAEDLAETVENYRGEEDTSAINSRSLLGPPAKGAFSEFEVTAQDQGEVLLSAVSATEQIQNQIRTCETVCRQATASNLEVTQAEDDRLAAATDAQGEGNPSTILNTKTNSTLANTSVADWLSSPPVSKLKVSFTPRAETQLQKFTTQPEADTDKLYKLQFLSGREDVRAAIVSMLSEDPRSVYRREKCRDALYFFCVDQVHVTCWFDEREHRAEVVRLQPLSFVEALVKKL